MLDKEFMFENEEWKTIEEFPHYQVSSYGRVKHRDRNYIRKITINERGFPVVLLSSQTSSTRYLRQVNKLVANAFLPTTWLNGSVAVWHKDGDLSNCYWENLMWDRRDRVLEWNEMHRSGRAQYKTPPVKNNRTGEIYKDAYDCAMQEGQLESSVIWKIEQNGNGIYDDSSRYRYIPEADLDNPIR
jgi:hypothetical protein